MKKKVLSLVLTAALAASVLAGCGSNAAAPAEAPADNAEAPADNAEAPAADAEAVDVSDFKVGVIYIGDENEGYTAAHMQGADEMAAALGLSADQVLEKTLIPEDQSCYDAAVDLAESGCDLIIGTSFGHEDYLIQAAKEFPEITFCHATGYQAALSGLPNMHNFFDNIYEARYVAGIAAGMKINAMLEAGEITEPKIGYIGAYPYAEVVSGYTSFFLGARSVCPDATMEVMYTNSWADMALEKETAESLIADGCVFISQHADTTGAPSTCQASKVPCVGYNVSMLAVAPDYALTSASNNWGIYYTYAAQCVLEGKSFETDWSKGYAEGAVYCTELGSACVDGTKEAMDDAIAKISAGELHVFDTSTFTVGGKSIEDLIAEGGDYEKYGQYVSDGYFHESELASAPSFDLRIDGIVEK